MKIAADYKRLLIYVPPSEPIMAKSLNTQEIWLGFGTYMGIYLNQEKRLTLILLYHIF